MAPFIIFSTALWSGLAPNITVWAFLNVAAGVLMIRRLLSPSVWILPSRPFTLAWGGILAWSALSLSWTSNFHATWTSIHKLILITIFSILFLNEQDAWNIGVRKAVIWAGALCAALWIFFPATARAWIPYPNLSSGFMAMAAVLAFGTFPFYIGSVAIFLANSLGAVLGWAGGAILELRRSKPRATLAFSALLVIISLIPADSNRFFDLWKRKIHDRYTFERITIWKDSLQMILANPLRGSGPGTFRDVYPAFKSIPDLRNAFHAHNEVINVLCESGIVGAALGLFLIILILRNIPRSSPWISAAAAALIQSFFDFNLRHPPVAVLFAFCLCQAVPIREPMELKPALQKVLLALTACWMILASLPGVAALVFVLNPRENLALALRLDPMNGFYRSQTGRMRDLEIAISLEPANVWYRRQAAQFYLSNWKISGNPASLEAAKKEYEKIMESAPNVVEFREEYKKYINH